MRTIRYGNYKYHVVTTFEDRGATFYVVRYYGRYKQWWHYEIWTEDDMKHRTAKP